MQKFLIFISMFLASACSESLVFEDPKKPTSWQAAELSSTELVAAEKLNKWWTRFEDESLNRLIDTALQDSPDRKLAASRIIEARGIRKATESSLFPQIGASASAGRQDQGFSGVSSDSFYEAGFDASFELDIFGVNRKNISAADASILQREALFHNVSLTLIADITRNYIEYRTSQNLYAIAQKNLESQENTHRLITDLNRIGSAPSLDVERSNNLVNTTRASIANYQREAKNARLRLSVLVGQLPEAVAKLIDDKTNIPETDSSPMLMAPASVLTNRPDIKAASAYLAQNSALSEAAARAIFPTTTISGFYGIADNALVNSTNVWNLALGTAVSLLDFGRIQGNIDASKAREQQAFELYRKSIINAVSEVETALTDYTHIKQQYASLEKAYKSAEKALSLSKQLFRAGEISFLDVLDSERSANNAEANMVHAKSAQAQSLVRLYKALGVY